MSGTLPKGFRPELILSIVSLARSRLISANTLTYDIRHARIGILAVISVSGDVTTISVPAASGIHEFSRA
jgi:hypothetical protein